MHARAQAVANDASGNYARLWLEGQAPKVGKVMAKFEGIVVLPEHDERLPNAMLVEVATECRAMAMAQGVARSSTHHDVARNKALVRQLDDE